MAVKKEKNKEVGDSEREKRKERDSEWKERYGRGTETYYRNWEAGKQCSGVPDPQVFGPPGSGSGSQRYGSFHHQAKILRKSLISVVLWLFYDSLKSDVNVSSKSKKQEKTFLVASWRSLTKRAWSVARSGSVSQRNGSEDPDPYQNVTYRKHCRKGVEGWMDMERGQDRRDKSKETEERGRGGEGGGGSNIKRQEKRS
jgi:hypothetical protein